jgi:hypothetical protein
MFEDRPTIKELIEAVREFLETKVSPSLDNHMVFHTRVAINVLKIAERELELGPGLENQEHIRLGKLLNQKGTLKELNNELCIRLKQGTMDYNNPDLVEHLRKTAVGRLAVDNPKYATYRSMLEQASQK